MIVYHDGVKEDRQDNILLEKWKYSFVTGDTECEKPEMCIFKNTSLALYMLNKHIRNNSTIMLHTDVDVDGIGSTYILNKVIKNQCNSIIYSIINKDKVHGIQQKHVDFIKSRPDLGIGLIIISDSSSNEIDIIKQFNCDVLVIDHHEILHRDVCGKCTDGIHDYVIVNNTIDNDSFDKDIEWLSKLNSQAFNNITPYKGDDRMSCGLVIYELLRVYCECFSNSKLLENLMLYQWVGTTLLTDAIQLLTPRNQWYMEHTVHSQDEESTLRTMQKIVNKWKATLDKTYIGYSFAPIINKAIRAGHSKDALSVVLTSPGSIDSLDIYKKVQEEAVSKVVYTNYESLEKLKQQYYDNGYTVEDTIKALQTKGYDTSYISRKFNDPYILVDITNYNVSPNYTGVIAGRLAGDNYKNTAVYTLENGIAKGSFRGRQINTDYRKFFDKYDSSIYAQGHKGAFGFRCTLDQLKDIMSKLDVIERDQDRREFLSVGPMKDEEKGVYHIESFDEFKQNGYLYRLALGNAKVASADEIYIKVPACSVVLKEIKGKLFLYDVLGLECKAFKQLSGEYFKLYLEYSNEINAFIKELN